MQFVCYLILPIKSFKTLSYVLCSMVPWPCCQMWNKHATNTRKSTWHEYTIKLCGKMQSIAEFSRVYVCLCLFSQKVQFLCCWVVWAGPTTLWANQWFVRDLSRVFFESANSPAWPLIGGLCCRHIYNIHKYTLITGF